MVRRTKQVSDEEFYSLRINAIWRHFKGESFAFWMICVYLFLEYVRPQSIYPELDIIPWTKLIVVGAIWGLVTDKTVHWVSSPINSLLLLFFLIILASSHFAYFPEVSYKNLDKYYLWVIIYFLIINIVNTRKRFFIFISIFLVASFKLSLSLSITWARRGFSFTDWGLMGPPGFFQNSGELAIQMLVFWPIAWAFVHSLKPYIAKHWYFFLMLMPITAIMVILGASSRGAQLALAIQLLVMNYRYFLKPKTITALGVSVFLIWTFLPEEQKERFENIGQDGTSRQRIVYLESGVEMIKSNQILGVGYFNFAPYFEKYYYDDSILGSAQLPHNILIQVGTDAGFLGLSVFFAILFHAFRIGRRFRATGCEENENIIGRCMNLSLIGFFVAGQFVTVTYYPFLWIHLALVVAMKNSFSLKKNKRKGRS